MYMCTCTCDPKMNLLAFCFRSDNISGSTRSGGSRGLLVIEGFVPVLVAVLVRRTFHLRQVLRHVAREATGRRSSAERLRHLARHVGAVSAAQPHVLHARLDQIARQLLDHRRRQQPRVQVLRKRASA